MVTMAGDRKQKAQVLRRVDREIKEGGHWRATEDACPLGAQMHSSLWKTVTSHCTRVGLHGPVFMREGTQRSEISGSWFE